MGKIKSKKVLFLALRFPKVGTTSTMYTDLVESFRDKGNEVYVVASSTETGDEGLFDESGVHVVRTKTIAQHNVNIIQKGIANLVLPKRYISAINKYLKDIDFDIILLPTPPITLLSVVKYLKKKNKTPVYLILRDIFPQNAVDIEIMSKKSYFYKYFRKLEIQLYNMSNSIGCMSPGNVDYVLEHNPYLDSKKVHILRNWQREHLYSKSNRSEIKKKYGLDNKFVVFFGGNISKPQKVENIVRFAKLYNETPNVVFFVIGKGTEKIKLERLIKKDQLTNFIMKSFVPREEYLDLIGAADVGLVSLDERFTIPNIPSKALSYFNAKVPIIALLDASTDFGDWVQDEIKAGYWAHATRPKELKVKLDQLIKDPHQREVMGINGYNYFVKNLNPEVAYQTIINSLKPSK